MVIHDIYMFENIAILVGFYAHKVIYHYTHSGKVNLINVL